MKFLQVVFLFSFLMVVVSAASYSSVDPQTTFCSKDDDCPNNCGCAIYNDNIKRCVCFGLLTPSQYK